MIDRYFARLSDELRLYRAGGYSVNTVFVGGGTPSVLPLGYMTRLFGMLRDCFAFTSDAEITVEVNPGTLTEEKVVEYKSLGINRISLGLQSIHENEQKALGRIHNLDDFLSAFDMLRAAGFTNIGVDLMYGIPEQTLDSFALTLDTVISLSPEHISVYGLIVEDGTPFGNMRDTLPLPSEDEECDMYLLACEGLARAGYRHYEISNYARLGYESRHNLKYWNCEEYIGIGAAAHSFLDGERYGNTRSLYCIERDPEYLDDGDREYEYIMMHLRLSDGLSLSDFENRFGYSLEGRHTTVINEYISLGLMKRDGDRLYLTERGFYVSNSILVGFL